MDYDKNLKPIVKVAKTEKPFNQSSYRQGDRNNAPVVKKTASVSPFSDKVMPKNKVTSSDSANLQKASKLPGRVSMEASPVSFS